MAKKKTPEENKPEQDVSNSQEKHPEPLSPESKLPKEVQ